MKATARRPTGDRRLEIAEAALRIIGERGFAALTTATLAGEVGLTTGALYRHFASLGDILDETVRHGVAKIEATFPAPSLPPVDRLLTLARNRVRLLGDDPGLVWLLRSEEAHLSLPPGGVELLRGVIRRSRGFLLEALREGAANGSIRADIKPELLLVPVVATIHAAIGLQGAKRNAPQESRPAPASVLKALALLLEPPHTPSRKRAAKKTTTK